MREFGGDERGDVAAGARRGAAGTEIQIARFRRDIPREIANLNFLGWEPSYDSTIKIVIVHFD